MTDKLLLCPFCGHPAFNGGVVMKSHSRKGIVERWNKGIVK